MHSKPRRRHARLLAILLALGFVAAACSGDDEGAGGEGSDTTVDGSVTTPTDAPKPTDVPDPVAGGTLRYALEGDSANPWTPQKVNCAISCHVALTSIFDKAIIASADGPVPHLLESFTPNADFTQWTFTARDGVRFHDGTVMDGAAIAKHFNQVSKGTLTGILMTLTGGFTGAAVDPADPMSAILSFSKPWADFPAAVATSQVGYIMSPTWIDAYLADPKKEAQPVGAGPFKFVSYTPGAGGKMVVEKNTDYFLADKGLPYLDEIEFNWVLDSETRTTGLIDGQFDLTHTSNGADIPPLQDASDEVNAIISSTFGETGYLLINTAPSYKDDAGKEIPNPLADESVRRALIQSINRQEFIDARQAGEPEVANGPFPPGSPGYLEDNGYPEYDPAAAKEAIDAYEAANGPIKLFFKSSDDESNKKDAELYKAYWEAVGVEADYSFKPQPDLINDALAGTYQINIWRNHGGFDPGLQYVWWYSTAGPLNFQRLADPGIDAALDTIRSTTDPAEKQKAAEDINRIFAEKAYAVWMNWTIWTIGTGKNVWGVQTAITPEGVEGLGTLGLGTAAQHLLTYTYLADPPS